MKLLSVAIAGAGPAGLASALYLRRAGHDVHLFERFDEAQPVGSGLIIQPTGMAILDDLGLADRMLGLGSRVDRLHGDDAKSGRTVLEVAYRKGQFGLGVHRSALFNVLHDAVVESDVIIHTSTEIAGTERNGGKVRLKVEDNARTDQDYDLIVDASGADSCLRQSGQIGATRKPLPYGAFWATLDWCGDGFDENALQQRYDKASVMIGVLPIGQQIEGGNQKAAFFWSLKPKDAQKVISDGIDSWKNRVADYWPQTRPYLDQIGGFDDLVLAQYAHHTLRTPHMDRIVHVGDSAHSTSPQLGQGANMALLDAKALQVALESCDSLERALKMYGDLRRWHVRLFQLLSLVLTPFYQSDSTLVPLARDTLISTIARIPPVPTILASMVAGTLIDPLASLGLAINRR